MKIAAVFIILLIVLLPVMGVTATGDGTIKGRLQTFVSYGLSLTNLLLCLLTIIVSIYSLTSDLQQRQIYTVITKPIRRFQLLLGKLLGVIILDVALLTLFAAAIYAITIYIPKFSEVTEDQQTQLNNEFFTARTGLTPAEADVTQDVLNTYKELEKERPTGRIIPGSVASGNYCSAYYSEKARKTSCGGRSGFALGIPQRQTSRPKREFIYKIQIRCLCNSSRLAGLQPVARGRLSAG